MALGIHIICEFFVLDPLTAWSLFQQSHPDLLTGPRRCYSYEIKCTLDRVATVVRKQGKPHFGISFDKNKLSDISYGHVRNYNHSLLRIENLVVDLPDADRWVAPFIDLPAFREAWLFDMEYAHWQNAEDPLQYTAVGRSYTGLPMKSNGLPYPLEQQGIDISKNPGRRILREGYVETVSAVMWLGEQFWALTGANKQSVLAADWLRCEQLPQGVLRIQASDTPFTTAEGASGDVQDRLRGLLFP